MLDEEDEKRMIKGVFDLDNTDAREIFRILHFKNKDQARPLLFLSLRKWGFPGAENSGSLMQRYKEELRSFLERVLSESSWRICLISTCQGRPGYTYNDAEFARSLIRDITGYDKDRLYMCSHPFHPRSYPSLISQCADLVLAMRMHFMIFSILAGIPVIGLAYEQKTLELARQAGLDNYCHKLEDVNSNDLWQTFLTLQQRQKNTTKTIRRACESLRARSLRNAHILKKVLRP
jgi:polysaccharide pyruvyl transferase WcaK-like protein